MPENTIQNDPTGRFIALLANIAQNLTEAAKIAAEQTAKDPDFPEKVAKACPQITEAFVLNMARVGNQQLHEKLLLAGANAGYAALRRLPYQIQSQKMEVDPFVEVVISGGQTLRVDVANLTPMQARQVFASDHIRTLPEQRAWLESRMVKAECEVVKVKEPFRIKGKRVAFLKACEFDKEQLVKELMTRGEIAQLLARLERD